MNGERFIESSLIDQRCSDLTFFEEKAIAALSFLCELAGNRLNHYKAAKLMYLFDRELLLETGEPAFYGSHYSLPAGPIVSEVNNAIKSCLPDNLDTYFDWKPYFKLDQDKHVLSQDNSSTAIYSGLLSDEERNRLTRLFEKYKDYSYNRMKEVMHKLKENIELQEGERRKLLSYSHILQKNGFSSEQIKDLLSEIEYESYLRITLEPVYS